MAKLLKLERLIFLPLLILISPSLLAEMKRVDMQFDNEDRHYLIYSPKGSSAESPLDLVIGFHGYAGTASGFELEVTGGFNQFADKYNFIAVYPQSLYLFEEGDYYSTFNDLTGSKSGSQLLEICTLDAYKYPKFSNCKYPSRCSYQPCTDDIGFVRQLITDIKKDYKIQNIYVFGNSTGGLFAQRFGCSHPELIKGILNVSATQTFGYGCIPSLPVSLTIYSSEKDTAVPPINVEASDGYLYEPMSRVIQNFVDKFKCKKVYNETVKNNETFVKMQYTECADEVVITSILNLEGYHVWPETGFDDLTKKSKWVPYGYCATDLQPELKNEKCRENLNIDPWGADFLVKHLLSIYE